MKASPFTQLLDKNSKNDLMTISQNLGLIFTSVCGNMLIAHVIIAMRF